MAEHVSDYTHGQMDIHQQQASFHAFMNMTKWGSLIVAVVVLFSSIMFCTTAGFLGAVVPAVVVAAVGIFLLRDGGASH